MLLYIYLKDKIIEKEINYLFPYFHKSILFQSMSVIFWFQNFNKIKIQNIFSYYLGATY